jgi:methionyl-tRNA formyltransferase
MKKYRVACLLSRQAGLSVLNTLFTPESAFEVVCLFTNRLEPSSKDPARPERPEYAGFAKIAAEKGYAFYTVDTHSEAKAMAGIRDHLPFDFIFSVSWAFLVPPDVLALPTIAPINQHRGKLPNYPLAAPVLKALQNNDDTIILSTHRMNEIYDEGEMLIETAHPTNYNKHQSLEANAERIKRELLPLYPQALIQAVQKLTGEAV